jgi:hypothetical protein
MLTTAKSSTLMLCHRPAAQVSEELRECGGLVVGVETAWVGEHPGVPAAERIRLEAHASVFDAGDDPIGADSNERDHRRLPAFDFSFETPAASAKFVVGEFISPSGGPPYDVRDTESKVEKKRLFKG